MFALPLFSLYCFLIQEKPSLMKSLLPPLYLLVMLTSLLLASCKDKTLFQQLPSSKTGITFSNIIVENDSINPIDLTNIYNGGGVGVGDFNNDGLQDLYFTGNLVPNQLYLNKGDLKFKDVTAEAGVDGQGIWSRGVAVIDINGDGWQDLYVCASMLKDPLKRQNKLYVNKGVGKDGVPRFGEMAAAYGLNDTTHSTMAAFFDYDNDDDLDLYIVVNELIPGDNPAIFRPRLTKGEHPSTGRLYRNDWNDQLGHGMYTNVSTEAGVTTEGYGHGVSIADFNKDGWKDIFVTNDFNSTDLLYINNGDGTFTDKADSYFKHTSANGMGVDVIDINNDGLSDVVEVDMNPEDNFRKKMMMGANSYQTYKNSDYYGYQYQYVRNTLQVNQGPRVNAGDSIGDPIFSDIGFYSGIAETDWSWTPLVQDFDNDGFRDIIITNGYPKDVTDRDFVAFRKESFQVASKDYVLQQIPQVKLHNYAFQNKGDLTFGDVTKQWGITQLSFSNGAVYADLDGDGDLDMVVNNINDEAMVYENTSRNQKKSAQHYLAVELTGEPRNRHGIGAWVEVYYDSTHQSYEQSPYRGYLSTIQLNPHFGLGTATKVDSVIIKWPNGKKQVLQNVPLNGIVKADIRNAASSYSWQQPAVANDLWFSDVTHSLGMPYKHQEKDFVDFNVQKLLPHKFSEYGPALATGDIDGNGLEDIVAGGASNYSPVALLQQGDGTFRQKLILPNADSYTKQSDDMGILLFDADGDGDLDLYFARGGYENTLEAEAYDDQLLINNGKGDFKTDSFALPKNYTSKSCVRAADYDRDGDLDLFIAGRVEPGHYPRPVSSFIYRNDSKNGVVKFTDVSAAVANPLQKIGLVSDAIWTDFDNDGWLDLMIAGEWMSVRFLKNTNGTFNDVTAATGVQDKIGWWNSLLPGDFDNDGDIDYVIGNLGLNSFYRASDQYPVRIYAKDFNNDGNYDAIPTVYLSASQEEKTKKEFPAQVRDDMTKQIIGFRSKYQNYRSYASATFDQMFTKEELGGAQKLEANYFSHSFLRNNGNGKFEMVPLPKAVQYSCINGMLAEDFDKDGNLDIIMTGNDYGTEVSVGRYDACNGVALKGDGKGGFKTLSILQSGWFVPGNAKALIKLTNSNGHTLVAASHNRGPLKVFETNWNTKAVPLQQLDVSVMVKYKNGMVQKREINHGASFLSQSGRFVNIDDNVASIEVSDNKGSSRTLHF